MTGGGPEMARRPSALASSLTEGAVQLACPHCGTSSVTFTIIVTPESIKGDVQQFLQSGAIQNDGRANSLLAKLNAAADKWNSGDCSTAANIYQAFINELQAQSGKGVDATATQIMIADAQYLITHCQAQSTVNP